MNNTFSNDRNDWRFFRQDEYLQDVPLTFSRYYPKNPTSDHEHCEFCGSKFSMQQGNLHEGYCTLDAYYWICKECYVDFRKMFNWIIVQCKDNSLSKISRIAYYDGAQLDMHLLSDELPPLSETR
jgi:hypothetical protein